MKLHLTIFFSFLILLLLNGQQNPIIGHFNDNMTLYNPASIPLEFFSNLNSRYLTQYGINYRSQWVGLDGAPNTQSIHFNKVSKLNLKPSVGFGGSIINDQIGPIGTTSLIGRVSAIFAGSKLSDGLLAGGLSFGINNYRINFNRVDFAKPELIDRKVSSIYPDVGLGLFFAKKIQDGILEDNVFYGGISIPHVFSLSIDYDDNLKNTSYNSVFDKHYLFNLGFIRAFDNDRFIEISTWTKYLQSGILHIDGLAKFQLNDVFYSAVGFSSTKSLYFESGTYVYDFGKRDNALKLSYTVINNSFVSSLNLPTTHEVSVHYFIGSRKNKQFK